MRYGQIDESGGLIQEKLFAIRTELQENKITPAEAGIRRAALQVFRIALTALASRAEARGDSHADQ